MTSLDVRVTVASVWFIYWFCKIQGYPLVLVHVLVKLHEAKLLPTEKGFKERTFEKWFYTFLNCFSTFVNHVVKRGSGLCNSHFSRRFLNNSNKTSEVVSKPKVFKKARENCS